MLSNKAIGKILTTRATNLRNKSENLILKEKRVQRICEAISWEGGESLEMAISHTVNKLPTGESVYFLKPGKEAVRPNEPNKHDMTPMVGKEYPIATFDDVDICLSKIFIRDETLFKFILVIIYRNAYMMDHQLNDGGCRYYPDNDVLDCIDAIQTRIDDITPYGGLFGLLNFIDLLGWNEDVKYHTDENGLNFNKKPYRVGRLNTLLSVINVPYNVCYYTKSVIERADKPHTIEFEPIYAIMQQLSRQRGVCPASDNDIIQWLEPYVYR